VIFYRCYGIAVNGFLALRDNEMNVCRYNRCYGNSVKGFGAYGVVFITMCALLQTPVILMGQFVG
jgi:hypothetical protein